MLPYADPHRIFDNVEERGGYFAKQPSHKVKLKTMRPLTHNCTSCCCHNTHNIFLLIRPLLLFLEKIIYCDNPNK